MDQVLFSEPSTKMREKIDALKEEEKQQKRRVEEQGAEEARRKKREAASESKSEVDKFLEERLG